MVIFSTHNPNHSLHISDKTLLLGRGRNYVFGDTSAVITERNLETVFGVETKIIEVPGKNGNRILGVVPIPAETEWAPKNSTLLTKFDNSNNI
jgi:ABC-type cobalamin/Fe3+-siderophores transport system ATPase subunit